ncbi:MAG: FAD-dependent oxidoreductase [Anaerolineae bacterium]|nr:FAD-dependent oxidoreductase [Anaerolineae bacterium]
MKNRVVVVGGGWAGCSAAMTAKLAGADEVIVLERTDGLLGTGLVGGIMRNNGRYTAAEEMIAMGGGQLFQVADSTARHSNFEFPGHKHATLYDVAKIEPAVRRCLLEHGIEVWLFSRVTEITRQNGSIDAVRLENGIVIHADMFVDATGTVGSQNYCTEHGNGCVMCIVRCPTFGPRVSLTGLAGIPEKAGRKKDGSIGAMSGSCKLNKDTIAPHIREQLEETGLAIIPIPEHLVNEKKLGTKACQQYALKEYADNVILLDTGQVKLMTSYMPLHELRQIPGLEDVRYEDPYSGTIGNSMRYSALSPRDDQMRVIGDVDNLFCGGEKAGLLVGHTEAMVTGALGGHNAVRAIAGRELLQIPDSLSVGDAITHVREAMQTDEGMTEKYTFSGSIYFKRMKERGLYTTDHDVIAQRVAEAGLTNIYSQRVL